MTKGIVFDIKEFAVHDGPGMRVTVFLKGCPLHCVWCHNPEGINALPQLMKNRSKCRHCGLCLQPCSHESCQQYGICTKICPDNLIHISGKEYTPQQLAQLLNRYQCFFQKNGGITFSGGEPLLQADFMLETIDLLQGANIAIETSAYSSSEVFERVIGKVDLIMLDMKHMDSEIHKKLTGVGNERILKNISLLIQKERSFTVRIPLIPSINDDDSNLERTAQFLKDARDRIKVELLPYNKLTGAKYSLLGQQYSPPFDEGAKVNANTQVFLQRGIHCTAL
ncbi:MAG: glycyl-radical enzyme activating protein [Clostridiaceae bacterium]|nr:glycyl-radical enzyme activating protein [Clostridiaceae bacterium]